MADVRYDLEMKLMEFGIDRPVYHGGDFTGVKIMQLLEKMDDIFESFKDIIRNTDGKDASDAEVEQVCDRYFFWAYYLIAVLVMQGRHVGC